MAAPILAASGEVDETSFGVGVEKLHANLIAHVESFSTLNDAALDGWIEDAYPRSLRRCAGADAVEFLANPFR